MPHLPMPRYMRFPDFSFNWLVHANPFDRCKLRHYPCSAQPCSRVGFEVLINTQLLFK
jgi:hypothetical protein